MLLAKAIHEQNLDLRISMSKLEEITNALRSGQFQKAQNNAMKMVSALNQAQATFAPNGKAWEETVPALERRAREALEPANRRHAEELTIVHQMQKSLLSFNVGEEVVLKPARNVRELSDKMDHYAASDMLVKFDHEMLSLHRSFSDYMGNAYRHLGARNQAISPLLQKLDNMKLVGGACSSADELQDLGKQIALADLAKARSIINLNKIWQSSAATPQKHC